LSIDPEHSQVKMEAKVLRDKIQPLQDCSRQELFVEANTEFLFLYVNKD